MASYNFVLTHTAFVDFGGTGCPFDESKQPNIELSCALGKLDDVNFFLHVTLTGQSLEKKKHFKLKHEFQKYIAH